MPVAAFDQLAARFEAFTAPPPPVVAVELASGRMTAGRQLGGAAAPRIQSRPLDPGAIVPSAIHPNLADPAAVAAPLRSLLESVGAAGQALTLLVPDLTARLSILDFDTLPGRKDQLDSLVRFRLRKSLPFAEEQTVISCQPLSATRLLVAIADRARLDEYENCLEAAGARAASVLPSGVTCLAAQPFLSHGTLLIRSQPGSLTTAFCWRDKIEFFRVVELSAPVTFEDVFPSVAFFRDRVESEPAASAAYLLYTAGLAPDLESVLREEAPWAELRSAATPEDVAVSGALRGRFA